MLRSSFSPGRSNRKNTAPANSHIIFCGTCRSAKGAGEVRKNTYGDLNAIVGEDQGRVGRSELSGRHCECSLSCVGGMNDESSARFVVDVVQLSPKRAEPQKIGPVENSFGGLQDLNVVGPCVFPSAELLCVLCWGWEGC